MQELQSRLQGVNIKQPDESPPKGGSQKEAAQGMSQGVVSWGSGLVDVESLGEGEEQ